MRKLFLLLTIGFTLSSFVSSSAETADLINSKKDNFATCHFTIAYSDGEGGFYYTEYSVYALNQDNCNSVYRQYAYLAR